MTCHQYSYCIGEQYSKNWRQKFILLGYHLPLLRLRKLLGHNFLTCPMGGGVWTLKRSLCVRPWSTHHVCWCTSDQIQTGRASQYLVASVQYSQPLLVAVDAWGPLTQLTISVEPQEQSLANAVLVTPVQQHGTVSHHIFKLGLSENYVFKCNLKSHSFTDVFS